MRLSTNNVLEGMNLMVAGLSVAMIGVSAWLAMHAREDCLTFLQWPFMVIGLLLFGEGLLGFIGSCRRSKPLLLLYAVLLLLIVLLLLGFTLFALLVTAQNGRGRRPAVRGGARFREYTSADFSAWLQERVGPPHWTSVQACLARGHLCRSLDKYKTLHQLYSARLSPTQVGCCKPPSICGFNFRTATTWAPSRMSEREPTSDCRQWSNHPSKLCFGCDACRAGEMQNVRRHWLHVATIGLLVLLLLFALLALTSIALHNLKRNSMPDEPKWLSPIV
ncbi:hypothetical protein L7F22_011213 [Adiantum nelumboides]|nr:hypothetical protein [Adiantum nelumboides]